MSDDLLRRILLVIAVITVLSGLAQIVAPGFVLGFIAGQSDALSRQLFATVGMFMAVTGALFAQALLSASREPAIPLWIAIQKFCAFAFVAFAVWRGIFAPLALGVGGFDALSGVLSLWFWRRLAQ